MVEPKPMPDTNRTTEAFWERLAQGRLGVQRCADCGLTQFPPRPHCPDCGSTDLFLEDVSGYGSVYGYSVIQRTPGDREDLPVVSALVELKEGPRILARVDCEPGDLAVNDRVLLDPSNLSPSDVRVTFVLDSD
jgi:uncharacterized OB-fold protein